MKSIYSQTKLAIELPIDFVFNYIVHPDNFKKCNLMYPQYEIEYIEDNDHSETYKKGSVHAIRMKYKSFRFQVDFVTLEVRKNQFIHQKFKFTDIESSKAFIQEQIESPGGKDDLLRSINQTPFELEWRFERTGFSACKVTITTYMKGRISLWQRASNLFWGNFDKLRFRKYWKQFVEQIHEDYRKNPRR